MTYDGKNRISQTELEFDKMRAVATYLDAWEQSPRRKPPFVKQIAEATGYSPPTLSETISDMVARGYISHKPRRRRDIKLTELGRQKLLGQDDTPEREEFVHSSMKPADTAVVVEKQPARQPTAKDFMLPEEWGDIAEFDELPVVAKHLPDSELIMELLSRGYTVSKTGQVSVGPPFTQPTP